MPKCRLSHIILALFLVSASSAWAQRAKPRRDPAALGLNDDQAKKEDDAKREALAAAGRWLEIFDSGEYGNAFQEMAPALKQVIDTEQWEAATKAIRQPLGRVMGRKSADVQYMETEPSESLAQLASGVRMFQEKKIQLPYREWVQVRCQARFRNRRGLVAESLQLVKDEDGQWKVIAILIQHGR